MKFEKRPNKVPGLDKILYRTYFSFAVGGDHLLLFLIFIYLKKRIKIRTRVVVNVIQSICFAHFAKSE